MDHPAPGSCWPRVAVKKIVPEFMRSVRRVGGWSCTCCVVSGFAANWAQAANLDLIPAEKGISSLLFFAGESKVRHL